MNRKNSALRVAFITDWQFAKLSQEEQQMQKKRALRRIQSMVKYPVVERGDQFDVCFKIIRAAGSQSWMLRKC